MVRNEREVRHCREGEGEGGGEDTIVFLLYKRQWKVTENGRENRKMMWIVQIG